MLVQALPIIRSSPEDLPLPASNRASLSRRPILAEAWVGSWREQCRIKCPIRSRPHSWERHKWYSDGENPKKSTGNPDWGRDNQEKGGPIIHRVADDGTILRGPEKHVTFEMPFNLHYLHEAGCFIRP